MSSSSIVTGGAVSVSERSKQFESPSSTTEKQELVEEHEAEEGETEDDGIDFAELVRNITGERQGESKHNENNALQEAFKILDFDEDGFITVSDLKNALVEFDDEEDEEKSENKEGEAEEENVEETAQDMIAEADFDGDGKISFDDFIKVLAKGDEVDAEPPGNAPDEQKEKKKKKKKNHKHAR